MKSKVTVLIVNYNSTLETIRYINHLKKQEHIEISFLIVDNCSPDNSQQSLVDFSRLSPNIKVILAEKNGGYAYGNNIGLKCLLETEKGNQLVIISNNDIEIPNEYMISELVTFYYKCKNPAFISPVMHINGEISKNCAWRLPTIKHDFYDVIPFFRKFLNEDLYYCFNVESCSILEVDCLPGSFFMGQLETFREIKFFDERTFLFGEERILAKKVKNLGKSNYLIRTLMYDHNISGIISGEITKINQMKGWFKGKEIFHKYYQNTSLLIINILRVAFRFFLSVSLVQMKYGVILASLKKRKCRLK